MKLEHSEALTGAKVLWILELSGTYWEYYYLMVLLYFASLQTQQVCEISGASFCKKS